MPHLLCKQLTLVLLVLDLIGCSCIRRRLSQSFSLHLGLAFFFLNRYEGVETEGLDILVVVSLEFFDEGVLPQTFKFGAVWVVEVSVVVLFDLKFLELAFYLR